VFGVDVNVKGVGSDIFTKVEIVQPLISDALIVYVPAGIFVIIVELREERLELTEDEKQKFWPVADEYLFKERELRMNFGLKMDFIPEKLSEKDAEEYFKMIAKFHQDEYELFKTYSEKIKNIIGVNKAVRFYALRQEFKKEMVKRAGGRPPKHPKDN